MKVSKILVPIDFSACSLNALEYALKLNTFLKAKLIIINCYIPDQPVAPLELKINPNLAADYKKETEEKILKLEGKFPKLQIMNYEYSINMKLMPDCIVKTAFKNKVDLIIMGTRGTNRKLKVIFGSNAYAVIKDSKVPVLTIPENTKYKSIHRVLLCADYKDIKNTKPLELVREITTISDANLHILHFNGSVKKMKENEVDELMELRNFFSGVNFSFHQAKNKHIEKGIEAHVSKYKVDLIVLLHRKRSFPESVFKQRVTRKVALQTRIPLLSLPELKAASDKSLTM